MRILFILLLAVFANQAIAQSTIADARRENIGSTVTVSGIVTNGDELGDVRYLQDSTAGIAVYDDKLSGIKRGDSITVSGKLVDYNNLLEISSVTTLTTHSSGNELPAPKIISIDKIGEEYEGQLLQFENVECDKAGSTFSGGTNYNFTDGTNTGLFRVNNGSPIINEIVPSGKISIVALCSQYSWENNDTQSGYQLIPRDMDDFISGSSVQFKSSVVVTNITKNAFELSWSTNSETSPFVRYGSQNNASSLTNVIAGESTTSEDEQANRAVITGLQASEIVYAQVFSANGTDTSYSAINAYVTESNSTGTINAYFNSPIDESKATESVAKNIGNGMADTLAAYINRAEVSIDFSIYNFNNSTISDALNAAHNRGVNIRLITCESTTHASIDDLDSEIPVLERPKTQVSGIMHNKFVIFDGNVADDNKAWLWSGSTNLTSGQLYTDANNMIFIQDKSLALTYKIEFEEMWGSTSLQPNANNAKFGENKTDNTPHELVIDGKRVECYFSPSDNTTQKLIESIATSDKDLSVQTMLITRTELANAIIDAYDRGVQVHVVTNDENLNDGTVNDILDRELPNGKFVFDDIGGGILHHKMAIIDAYDSISDPQVITGSHNWSASANTKNDENTLIIHNSDVANQYFQQFTYRFEQNNGDLVVSAKDIQIQHIKVYPNPTQNKVYVSANETLHKIEIYSIQGTLVREILPSNNNTVEVNLVNEKSGIYILKVEGANRSFNTYKIVKK